MVPTSSGRINLRHAMKIGAFVISLALVLASGVPSAAQQAGDEEVSARLRRALLPAEATAVLDRVLAFARAHPRMRGRFEHVYLDRGRTTELRSTGRFAIELPRIGMTIDGDDAHTIAIDETTARVLVPREGEAPLLLAFRLETTPLPPLLAVLAGTTSIGDAYAARRIAAEGGDVVELRPTDPSSQIDRIWIEAESSGAIARVMVVDWRGATHRVVLTETSYPARLPASALAPVFPEGAVTVEP